MWLQCFGKHWWFPAKWWFLPWKLPPPFQMQIPPAAGLGQNEQEETLRLERRWGVWSGHLKHVWRMIWDKQDEKEFRNLWLIRLELQSDHLAKKFKKLDGCRLHRSDGTEKVPPAFPAMLVLGFQKSLLQESRISWNYASFIQKMINAWLSLCTQISVLLVWLLNSETGFCLTKLNSNKQLVLSSLLLWKVSSFYFILLREEVSIIFHAISSLIRLAGSKT